MTTTVTALALTAGVVGLTFLTASPARTAGSDAGSDCVLVTATTPDGSTTVRSPQVCVPAS